jgi:hypothetical protein
MTTETIADKRKKVRDMGKFLPDEDRISLMEKLEKVGLNPAEMSDSDLVKSVAKVANEEMEKNITYQSTQTARGLNFYVQGTHLRDKEFIKRLFMLNVPQIFLPAFKDEDQKCTDKEIWSIVQKSGIHQMDDPKEINKERTVRRIITA